MALHTGHDGSGWTACAMNAMYGSLRGGSEETHGNFTVRTGVRPADFFSLTPSSPGG